MEIQKGRRVVVVNSGQQGVVEGFDGHYLVRLDNGQRIVTVPRNVTLAP